jgi:crotonobetainyl-CoA:carnitine CoA-transferase CaiB-like acyl-CoA transferase
MTERPLEGLLVIDLSKDVAGACCCSLLAATGAEVIRVEPPGGGDPLRGRGPLLEDVPTPENSALFHYVNAGKKSVTLDCEQAEGRKLLRTLADKADALVEDVSPGHLPSLGLGYDDLSPTNPRLVMTSITPYGSWGRRASYRLDNLTLLAASGRLSLGLDCESEETSGHAAEYEVGLNAFAATLAGLVGVAVSERGQHIEIAAVECLAAADLLPGVQARPVAEPAATLLAVIEHQIAGRLCYPPPPLGLSGVDHAGAAPLIGEHNQEVYGGMLGLTGEELASLSSRGVI